eukprot:gnl/TRDRNA2_/TRDRNA2_170947_c0_seq1.p1 gnl/TRDRNA2_/TRDRNA2_170947_c0~~gnl/TRDRNA2_/TRDRNA2_170947_c0_seq1.p1  ORF type:complete len:102 (+),score=11.75 gnl/TRDRNA2_/TRDRNA2_170947_c0_seq1:13-318(+)
MCQCKAWYGASNAMFGLFQPTTSSPECETLQTLQELAPHRMQQEEVIEHPHLQALFTRADVALVHVNMRFWHDFRAATATVHVPQTAYCYLQTSTPASVLK